jgi:cardiolipin synthase
MRLNFILITLLLFILPASAQTSDSVIVQKMREYGVRFTNDNDVKLLMSGKD